MRVRILIGILLTLLIACSKSPTDSSDKSSGVSYSLSDLVGMWVGSANTFSLNLTVDSEGNVSGSGVSSEWTITATGRVTGGGSFAFISEFWKG